MALFGSLADLASRHGGAGPLARALGYLASLPPGFLDGVEPGFARRDDLGGDALFALHQAYWTKAPPEARLEGHRRYVDVQFLHRGAERILLSPFSGQEIAVPYDDAKDILFYQTTGEVSSLLLTPGTAAVFFPEDLHAPGLHPAESPVFTVKTVIKAALDAF